MRLKQELSKLENQIAEKNNTIESNSSDVMRLEEDVKRIRADLEQAHVENAQLKLQIDQATDLKNELDQLKIRYNQSLSEATERWEELNTHSDWQFSSPAFPSFSVIIEGFAQLVKRHPQTIFIGAHVGCYAENLSWVADLIDHCPNFYVDISARIGELGRQPYTARQFLIEHSNRILFGSDFGPDLDAYRLAYRFLETDDEYFNYNVGDIPQQGRWFVYGLSLPEDVLQKIYHINAEKLFLNEHTY